MTSPRRVLSALLPTALAAALVATTPSASVQAVEPSPMPDYAHDPDAEPLPTLRDLAGRPGEGVRPPAPRSRA
jgi:hypothetical protein